MNGPASAYAAVTRQVGDIVHANAENDPTVIAYMVMRAAALIVRARRGQVNAATILYRLADEMVCDGVME